VLRIVDSLPPSYDSVVKFELPPPAYDCLVIDMDQSKELEPPQTSAKPGAGGSTSTTGAILHI